MRFEETASPDPISRPRRARLALFCAWFGVFLGLPVASLSANPPASPADDQFVREVLPTLVKHCAECHDEESSELGLTLTSRAAVLKGSETGAVLLPGKAAESLLVQVLGKDADPHMPPEGQLAANDVAAISRWIEQLDPATQVGAAKITADDRNHWSLQPLAEAKIPSVQGDRWSRTPIDRFVLARLNSAGLTPAGEADRATLLRRVYFDLIGLPPSPEEVAEFVSDDSPAAYELVVQRLLASPHYGQRWGRHWLDLARYADSSGFHNDLDRPNAWRYRDYVLDSLNADKPYGQFIREQLAGDELSEVTLQTWIATGFCSNGPSNEDNMGMGLAREKYRMDELDDVISTTGNVFLGMTLGCARCHDHKYDPLTQRDYYRFMAFFARSEKRQLSLTDFQPNQPRLAAANNKPNEKSAGARVWTDHGQKPRSTRILWRGDVRNPGPIVRPGVPAVLTRDDDGRRQQPPSWQSAESKQRLQLANWIADPENPLTWRVMANRIWQHHFGRGLVATPSNFGRLGERPTHPQLLDWLAGELRRDGSIKSLHRLIVTSAVYRQSSQAAGPALLADPGNQLLWRMNRRRLEAEPLRDAFLSVAGNLNTQMGGPGVKPRIRPDLLVASQRNKWPIVKREGPEHWRRSVYVYVKRQLQLPLLELLDAPSTTHSCARREESMVPTQSLLLMNDEFVREQSGYFADRVVREAGADPRSQIERAMWIALSRPPPAERIAEGVAFLNNQSQRLTTEGLAPDVASREALADFCHVLMNLSEFVYVD